MSRSAAESLEPWSSMSFRRGNTLSPMSKENIASAWVASSSVSRRRVLLAGFNVVCQSCSGIISPRPYTPRCQKSYQQHYLDSLCPTRLWGIKLLTHAACQTWGTRFPCQGHSITKASAHNRGQDLASCECFCSCHKPPKQMLLRQHGWKTLHHNLSLK